MVNVYLDDDRAAAATYVDQATLTPMAQLTFNAAVTSVSPTEVSAVIRFGQRPLALLIMSPTTAKTFAQSLLARVAEYETTTGCAVKSLQELVSKDQA